MLRRGAFLAHGSQVLQKGWQLEIDETNVVSELLTEEKKILFSYCTGVHKDQRIC